jgi:hypothetical protein
LNCVFFCQSQNGNPNNIIWNFSYSFPCNRIEIRTKIYKTKEHPQVATTLANIAEQRSNLGDYQGALEDFEKVLGKRTE